MSTVYNTRSTLTLKFLFLSFIAAIITLIFAVLFYQQNSVESVINDKQQQQLFLVRDLLRSQINTDIKYTTLIPKNEIVSSYISNQSPESKSKIEEYFVSISESNPQFDSIRIINLEGEELIRVNSRDGKISFTPSNQLQNKKDRYYFTDTLALSPGQVYVSYFDLNIEHRYVELPQRPTLRFSTQIVHNNQITGILVINIDGQSLLDILATNESDRISLYLANDRGYWLKFKDKSAEWIFMFDGDHKKKTVSHFYPELWEEISDSTTYATVNGPTGTFASLPLYNRQLNIVKASEELYLVSYITDQTYTEYISYIKTLIILVLIFITLGLSFLFITYLQLFEENQKLKLKQKNTLSLEKTNMAVTFNTMNQIFTQTKQTIKRLHENGLINNWTEELSKQSNYGLQFITRTTPYSLDSEDKQEESHELSLRNFLRDTLKQYTSQYQIEGDALISATDEIETAFIHAISYLYVFANATNLKISISQSEQGINILMSAETSTVIEKNKNLKHPIPSQLEFAHNVLEIVGGEILVSHTLNHVAIKIKINGV